MNKFINPYTFVPIEKKNPMRGNPHENEGRLSGCIECKIDTLSPLFIPNTSNDFCEGEHKRQVFFSYNDLSGEKYSKEIRQPQNPVIPGSEIRGMIRNVYEQLTNSCFLHIDESNFPYKRTSQYAAKKLCIMKYDGNVGKWKLYKAKENRDYYKKALIENEDGGLDVDPVWEISKNESKKEMIDKPYMRLYKIFKDCSRIRIDDIKQEYPNAFVDKNGEWYVHLPQFFPGKNRKTGNHNANRQVIYTDKYLENGVEVSDANLKRFEHVIGDSVKGGYVDLESTPSAFSIYFKKYKNKEPLIVYVDEESYNSNFKKDKVIYMSCSSITKEFFSNTIPKILENSNEHQPCKDKNNTCPACRLFGMIGDNGGTRGKLRFTDGIESSHSPEYGHEMLLQILGSPRISSTEFYLQKPQGNPDFWNYDYHSVIRKDIKGKKYEQKKQYEPTLSGRKVYWNRKLAPEANPNDSNMNMNVTVTPLKKAQFKFSVYFDNLTDEELNHLLFCLQLGNGANHKIGHGKPLGFGKIKTNIERITLKSYEKNSDGIKINYTEKNLECAKADIERIAQSLDTAKQILKYSRDLPQNGGDLVDYPRTDKSQNIFSWFTDNRGDSIKCTLPKIMDADQTLPMSPGGNKQQKTYTNNRR